MKIKLSTYWWTNLYGQLGIYTIFIIFYEFKVGGHVSELIKTNEPSIYYLMYFILPMVFGVFFFDAAILIPRKFLRIISVEPDKFISTFFGFFKCEVNRNRRIYYVVFDCKESNFGGIKKFFAISNEPFVFENRKATWHSKNRFIDYYDYSKVIIFPYNCKTIALIEPSNWICINEKKESF